MEKDKTHWVDYLLLQAKGRRRKYQSKYQHP
jgi:hypothetical protein